MYAPGGIRARNPNINSTDVDRIRYQNTLLNCELRYIRASTVTVAIVWYLTYVNRNWVGPVAQPV
jgi:hypothetical protein